MPYFVAFEPEKTEIAIWWQSEVCSFEKLAVKTVNIMILFINRIHPPDINKYFMSVLGLFFVHSLLNMILLLQDLNQKPFSLSNSPGVS